MTAPWVGRPVDGQPTYRARVAVGWVVYDGERQRHGGEVVEASEEQVVDWLRNGWVDRQVPPEDEGD